jgi:hypothetical protein
VGKTFLYRWFGVGKLPSAVRDQIGRERVLFEAEGIRVSRRRSGRVPGSMVAGSGVNVGWGAFAVTDRRVIGTRGSAKLVDVPFDATGDGPVSFTLDATGLHVEFDLAGVHPSCSGEMRLHFQEALSPEVLAGFPTLHQEFHVDAQAVVRLFGSRKQLPG